jgi:hypothetical protein
MTAIRVHAKNALAVFVGRLLFEAIPEKHTESTFTVKGLGLRRF